MKAYKKDAIFKDKKLEAFNKNKILIFNQVPRSLSLNGFTEAIHIAYTRHYGLSLCLYYLLIIILQGLGIHINLNNGKCKKVMGTDHEEKKDIKLNRLSFRVIDKLCELLNKLFSASNELSIAVTSLTIMDIYKRYIGYTVCIAFGIPGINLFGTNND
ncbi:hypothetical protein K502DRAFT_349916 [Neoconidiobolus thromboides FSU 785]|nr:hypothetical protein K502DRAFT_349916 [Neoconidiobolus thromboides FSU 785]